MVLKQQKKNGRETGLLDIDSCRCLYLLETEELDSVLQSPAPETTKERKGKKGIIKRMNKPLGLGKSVSPYTWAQLLPAGPCSLRVPKQTCHGGPAQLQGQAKYSMASFEEIEMW